MNREQRVLVNAIRACPICRPRQNTLCPAHARELERVVPAKCPHSDCRACNGLTIVGGS